MIHKSECSFDYLFIGLGAANSLIIINMFNKGLLKNKKIAIIEPQKKNVNDRTFCFWTDQEEASLLQLSDLIQYEWDHIRVGNKVESISPNKYFHIKGLNLYNKIKEILIQVDHQLFESKFTGEFSEHSNHFLVCVNGETISTKKVFDSTIANYEKPQPNQSHLFQSFFGIEAEIINGEINNNAVTMMDFDIPQHNNCQFLYILPYSNTHALFEVTRFGETAISQAEAEEILTSYFSKQSIQYRIIETEAGVIPMSSAPIVKNYNHINWVHTGSKANMIKPTTGYAFHSMAVHAKEITNALVNNTAISGKTKSNRFSFYDRLLLKIIETKPEKGKLIFSQLFNNVPTKQVLTFLNERSSIISELKIFSKLPIPIFLHRALQDFLFNLRKLPPTLIACFTTLFILLFNFNNYEVISWIILAAGFLFIGLTHGAIDHLTNQTHVDRTQLLKFILSYLSKAIFIGILWLIIPDIALIVFIIYSAWHFGQADFNEWKLKGSLATLLWGLSVLTMLLSFHVQETLTILNHIQDLKINLLFTPDLANTLLAFKLAVTTIAISLAVYYRSKEMATTIGYLICTSYLPLMMSFGIYFIFQHSLHGWNHLKIKLSNQKSLWLQSIPFSLGGAFILSLFTLYYNEIYLGVFFIILSCLSIPHIISMDQFYHKTSNQNTQA